MVLPTRVVVVLVVMMALCSAGEGRTTDEEWESFKERYNKTYSSNIEDKVRREIFLYNKQLVKQHNYRYAQNLTSFRLALNHLGDKMTREITTLFTGLPKNHGHNNTIEVTPAASKDVTLPSTVDWRKKGAVTGVKSQLQCASGWAFATTGSLEGQIYRHWAKLYSMSEQNLIDCCHLCYGCRGGRMDYAFTYIMQNGGLDTEAAYPYEARDNVCRYHPAGSVTRIRGYSTIPAGDEKALQTAVATIGPVAVAIDASLSSFHYYTHGVYYDPNCSPTQLTHGALVVGYGREAGRDYWLVKNSWGTNWGDQGYIKMARNLNNNCGIASAASYPFL